MFSSGIFLIHSNNLCLLIGVFKQFTFNFNLYSSSLTILAAAAAAAKSLQKCLTLCDPIVLGLSRQEHWSGLPFPSPVHESKK